MTNTSRRGFLGMLASLPIVGALFGKAQATLGPSGLPIDEDAFQRHIRRTRVIRWIPVTERLPRMTCGDSQTPYSYSTPVLIISDMGIIRIAQLTNEFGEWGLEFKEGTDMLSWTLRAITHWAELPAPPETKP